MADVVRFGHAAVKQILPQAADLVSVQIAERLTHEGGLGLWRRYEAVAGEHVEDLELIRVSHREACCVGRGTRGQRRWSDEPVAFSETSS